ncbi:MAG: protein-tyrosine-phosphatase [Actinomycetota bacterium]
MTSILVVCTGNICRSPIAEGLLRDALQRRFGDAAPMVSSAGTSGLEGSHAMPESVQAAQELGVDIAGHRGRRLTTEMAEGSDLLLCMASNHSDVLTFEFDLGSRAFTLKELVRLLESLPALDAGSGPEGLVERLAAAQGARVRGAVPSSRDNDIADPLGQPIEAYRAIAWEIETWMNRLVDGLFGPVIDVGSAVEGN